MLCRYSIDMSWNTRKPETFFLTVWCRPVAVYLNTVGIKGFPSACISKFHLLVNVIYHELPFQAYWRHRRTTVATIIMPSDRTVLPPLQLERIILHLRRFFRFTITNLCYRCKPSNHSRLYTVHRLLLNKVTIKYQNHLHSPSPSIKVSPSPLHPLRSLRCWGSSSTLTAL